MNRSPRTTPLVTDLALAQRLERAESSANAAFCDARVAREPASGAAWRDLDGTYAMFDGPESPVTQTFGLGLFAPPSAAHLATLESFFLDRGAPVFHEVSPLGDPALLALLWERRYRAIEQTSVLWQPLDADDAFTGATTSATDLVVRRIVPGEEARYADTSAAGWSADPTFGGMIRGFALVTAFAKGAHPFIVESGGTAIAAGALGVHGGVALLAGASTRTEYRGRGAQAALLHARLAFARTLGCDIAMMGAAPGSSSQRNAERQGFRIAYTRMKWELTE